MYTVGTIQAVYWWKYFHIIWHIPSGIGQFGVQIRGRDTSNYFHPQMPSYLLYGRMYIILKRERNGEKPLSDFAIAKNSIGH